ncbi:Hypothetical Protein RradSPS_0450 [Rubrobacter radiotolerans]|uniref:Uncharacterized protein n=1 Tax=Rubrobacter radiotolerans TaxID=42256 RepID=A0A023X068_RUBRA|nr:hypothetical protein [Rubrobacter radiotolerans]AHY45733.1 Hypothetical Protein RradSPS_0450 [Rubrobacter radiotolerans]MDX5893149.1 hypothetical protein [Rubrobacter radiotolerans]SMC03158.1 hypothetical protein SAMN00767673_0452 [Rubrobacter radiotolerans DSM 5868]
MAGSLSRREGRRALTFFGALAALVALLLVYDTSSEQIVQSLGVLAGAGFLSYFLLSKVRPDSEAQDEIRGRDALILLLAIVAGVMVYPFAAAFVVDFVPELVREFLGGLMVGAGLGGIIWRAASYKGSYGRSLKIISFTLGTIVLLVVGAYVLIEYVLGPLIRVLV